MRDPVQTWSERLGELPGGWTIDHNDLHQWNVLVGVTGVETSKFFDWGDAVVAHPFASLLVPLTFLRTHLGSDDESPALLRVRDAYLDAWRDLGSPRDLLEAVELSCRLAKVARALNGVNWGRGLTGEAAEKFARWPFESIVRLLDDSYLGCE